MQGGRDEWFNPFAYSGFIVRQHEMTELSTETQFSEGTELTWTDNEHLCCKFIFMSNFCSVDVWCFFIYLMFHIWQHKMTCLPAVAHSSSGWVGGGGGWLELA